MAAAKNLYQSTFPAWKDLREATEANFESVAAGKDPYSLSVVLLAAGMLGDAPLFSKILKRFDKVANEPRMEFHRAAWLFGRAARATQDMGHFRFNEFRETARNCLNCAMDNRQLWSQPEALWALSYYAGLRQNEYQATKKQRKELLADVLKSGAGLSDKTWCLVMEIDAAGRVQDKEGYQFLLIQMRALTGENDIAAALAAGVGENDFPLWATSIVQQSAAMMGDRETYALLCRPIADLMNSLPERSGDYILGRCTHAMAQIHQYHQSHSLPDETKTPAADVQTSGPGCAIWPVMAGAMIAYVGVATDWEGVNTTSKIALQDWHWGFNENLRQERMAMKTAGAAPDGFASLGKWFDESTSGIDAAGYRAELQVRDWADKNPQQATAMTWAISLLAVSVVALGACRQWRHHRAESHKGEVPPSPPSLRF